MTEKPDGQFIEWLHPNTEDDPFTPQQDLEEVEVESLSTVLRRALDGSVLDDV